MRKRLKNLLQTRSINEYTKVFRSLVLELGDRIPDEDSLVFSYVDGLKEDVLTQMLLQRPNFLKLINLQRKVIQNCLEEGSKGGKACNNQSSNGSNQGGMEEFQWSLVC